MRFHLSSTALGLSVVAVQAYAQTVPSRLSDKELWQLNSDFSESAGYFRSDNLLSNETGFQYVIPALQQRIPPGGVYLGVGPEQNFTYIVALKPKIAFIIDIRRGNMIEHLMYKALVETSRDRADFLSKLFSRPRPAGLDTTSTAEQLFAAYEAASSDSMLYRRNLAEMKRYLTQTHGFTWSDSDSKQLDYIYTAFFAGGPGISYSFPYGGGFGRGMPTYSTLQTATDSTGKNWAYLATEANFRWLKDFESKNLLVPVVGNFAGPKAVRDVGHWVRDHHAIVSAFYTSNVEQYLWQQGDDAPNYYKNVATLPIDSTSTFIRSIGGGFRGYNPGLNPSISSARARLGGRLPSVISAMQEVVKAFNGGKLTSYADVIAMSR